MIGFVYEHMDVTWASHVHRKLYFKENYSIIGSEEIYNLIFWNLIKHNFNVNCRKLLIININWVPAIFF